MKDRVGLRSAVRVAAVLRRIAWFVVRPRTIGAQVIVVDHADRVLLVRHSYDRHFLRLPGGGTKRAETFAECAARELREEVSLVVKDPATLELLGVYTGRDGPQNACHTVFVAPAGTWQGTPQRSPEIDTAEFHSLYALPDDVSPAVLARLEELRQGRRGIAGSW